MAIERRNPLPVGRYWIYVLEGELGEWSEWLMDHSATVHVVASERKTAMPNNASIVLVGAGVWVLFDVITPTEWVGLGYPTIVTDMTIRRSEQVEQFPPPDPDGQLAGDVWREVKSLALLGAGVYLGGILLQKALKS